MSAAQINGRDVDYSTLPDHMREGARGYLENGWRPGSFLEAVLSNDLVHAYARADVVNTAAMRDWASWLYNECPTAAWGSREKVKEWSAKFDAEGS